MKIKRIETFSTKDVAFVRVTADTGAHGWGQLSTYNADISALVLHRQVAPWVLNAEAHDVTAVLDLVPEREHKFPGSYLMRALGGLDTALWDFRGKLENRSVCELIG